MYFYHFLLVHHLLHRRLRLQWKSKKNACNSLPPQKARFVSFFLPFDRGGRPPHLVQELENPRGGPVRRRTKFRTRLTRGTDFPDESGRQSKKFPSGYFGDTLVKMSQILGSYD